jgi:glycogen operon protein
LRDAHDTGWRRVRAHARGNNNAYCQDNDISWFDWSLASLNSTQVEFFRKAIAFTRASRSCTAEIPAGRDLDADGVPDLAWFAPDGGQLRWQDENARTLCYQLDKRVDGPRPRSTGCSSS